MPTTITVPITSVGGTPPYLYQTVPGISTTFPGTINLDNTNQTMFLDATAVNSGTYSIRLKVIDFATNVSFLTINVVVDDPTIFSILNNSQSFAPSSFPAIFSIPLVSNGGSGYVTWSIISSVTTVPSPTIDSNNTLHFTLTSYGSFTVGLNAVDSIGNSVSTVVTYSINSSTVFSLVDGQLETLVNVPTSSLGTHNFSATIKDSSPTPVSASGSFYYQAKQPVSSIHVSQAYFDHYWGPNDNLAIVFPVLGDFQGFSLGTPTLSSPSNGLTVSVDSVNKIVKVQGPPTSFRNSELRIPLPILQGTTQVATVSREYTLLSENSTASGFSFTAYPKPYIVGDSIGLNPLKPYFNSPNISKNVNYSARVQIGSTLPAGISLDANTSLLYGTVAGGQTTPSIIEYIDSQNLVHGTVTINWTIFTSQFTLSDNLVDAKIQTPYPTATASTNCISSNSPSPLASVSVVKGVLPTGLKAYVDTTINAPNGVVKIASTGNSSVAGTPTESGYFDVWFQVTNTNGQQAYLYKRFTSNYVPPLVILTQQIASIVTGQSYGFSLQGFGGVPPYTWSSSQWPGGTNNESPAFTGITLSSTGNFSGTTTAVNGTNHNDTFVLTDSVGNSTSAVLNVNVNNTLRITTTILPIIVPGQPYSFSMSALGGTSPYTWSDDGLTPPSATWTLPSGISFNSSTGVFSGITSATSYSQTLTMKVKDAVPTVATGTFTLQIGSSTGLQIDTSGVGTINVGVAYQGVLRAVGPGTAPFSWQIPPASPNSLPAGLVLTADSSNQGVTATISGVYSGTSFTNRPVEVEVTDSGGNSAFAYMLLSTGTDLAITTASLPSGIINTSYTTTLAASGGVAPYTFSTSSILPGSLSLTQAGVLSGNTGGSAFNAGIVFNCADSATNSAPSKTLNLLIQASTLTITTASLPSITAGSVYGTTLTATGGTSPYTWSISPLSSTTLPSGLTLSPSTGVVSGTTTQVGTRSVTFRVTDNIGAYYDKTLSVTVTTGVVLKTGLDYTNGLVTNSLGYVSNGNVGSVNPRPNLSFYVIASGVLSTQTSQITAQLGGLTGATATVLSITSGVATIQITGPFQNGTLGSNNLTVTITDQGVTVSATFTWTVYINPALRLAPGTGFFPTLSVQYGGTGQSYIPVLENTSGYIYIYNDPSLNIFSFQTYNGFAVDKTTVLQNYPTGVLGLSANNTEWNGRLAFAYSGGNSQFGYNGAAIDANVVSTSLVLSDADIAWYQDSNKSLDIYVGSGVSNGAITGAVYGVQAIATLVNYLLDPHLASDVSVSPLTIIGDGTQKTFTISLIKPLPPLQSNTAATIIWGGTVLTTNSITPIYSNGIPATSTTYSFNVIQFKTGYVENGSPGTLSVTLNSATTSGNQLMVTGTFFDYAGPGTLISPTISDTRGNVWTRQVGYVDPSSEWCNFIWTAPITSAGTTTITLSVTGTQFNSLIGVIANEVSGLLVPVSVDVQGHFTGSTTSTFGTGSVTTSNANDVVVSVIDMGGAAPSGYTNLGTVNIPAGVIPASTVQAAYLKVSSTGTYNPTWTGSSFNGSGITAAFKLNPVTATVPNYSGISGYTVQATPPVISTASSSTLNLTLHGVITYLSGDSFVTSDVTYMNNVNVATVSLTVPAAPSSGGGGGGCPTLDMFVQEGVVVSSVAVGSLLDCLTGETISINSSVDKFPVEWTGTSEEVCYLIVAENGAEVELSGSTPIPTLESLKALEDNRVTPLTVEEVFDKMGSASVLTDIEGKLEWSFAKFTCIGKKQVARLYVGGRNYAAGRDAKKRVFSHNLLAVK